MTGKIINIPLSENIIDFTSDYLLRKQGNIGLISGGKRPFLFIKRKLAMTIGKSFYSPAFFTNDDFIEKTVFDNTNYSKIPDIEAAYILFQIIEREVPALLKGGKSFADFMQWAFEILSFIEQMDLENVSEKQLKNIKVNADIGYDVPDSINDLLKNIFRIREKFHLELEKSFKTTKGFSFLKAAEMPHSVLAGNFDELILMSPFYLHKTELEIYKKIYELNKLTVIVHGDPNRFSALKKIYDLLVYPMPPAIEESPDFKLNIYSAADDQSQAALLKNLISKFSNKDLDKTAIIVPDSKTLQPVIAEISAITENYNVSAGYPASKTVVFDLLNAIIAAQQSKKGKYYYSADIVNVLTNPLVKNMRFFAASSVSRIVTHKLVDALDSSSESTLSGRLFISFQDIFKDKNLMEEINVSVAKAWKPLEKNTLENILQRMFSELFLQWEKGETLKDFADNLLCFIEDLLNNSVLQSYPLNSEAVEILISAAESLKYGEVAKIKFSQEDILNIFKDLIENSKIALPGSPLKGLQILGLLESRNLSFENVFIVSMSDSIIPAIKKESPLIPKDIMYALGIEMAKKEYEIQEYHFERIIAGSKSLNLIYSESEQEERSRFIEKLMWKNQKESGKFDSIEVKSFIVPEMMIKSGSKRKYIKTAAIKDYLKKMSYSHSKIDTYLRCKLEFYFKYIIGVDEGIEVGREISDSDIGIFIHRFLNKIFHENLKLSDIQKPDFLKHYMTKLDLEFESSFDLKFREDAFLIKKVLSYRMENLLKYERERSYDHIYKCEVSYKDKIETSSGKYDIECIIDRIDSVSGQYIILDYKSGAVQTPFVSRRFEEMLADGFERKTIKKAVKSLQLPLYKYIFEKSNKNVLMCGIYGIKESAIYNFSDQKEVYDKCIDIIRHIVDEINTEEFFEFDESDRENCEKCKFFYLCR